MSPRPIKRTTPMTLREASAALGQGPSYLSQRKIRWAGRARWPEPVDHAGGYARYEYGDLKDWLAASKRAVGRPRIAA